MILFNYNNEKFLKFIKSAFNFNSFEEFCTYYETKKEKDLIELLTNFNISASVKLNKKSLPFQHSKFIINTFSSCLNEILFTQRLNCQLLQHLLELDVEKIRFYIEITPYKNKTDNIIGLQYSIYYYVHK